MVSVRGLWFRPGETVEACAEDWMRRLARTRELGSQVPYYLEIRYEALVGHSEATLREVCAFLELTFDASMLAYHAGAGTRLEEHEARYTDDGRLIVSKAERVRNQHFVMEPPRTDRIGRWRSELTQAELHRFDAVAGEWLDRLGYRRSSRVV